MREVAASGATVIFVSHNLKAVSDLCRRSILLDGGTIVEDGPTTHVLQTYLERERSKLSLNRDVDVAITDVSLIQNAESAVRICAGEDASVSVTFTARRSVQRIAVILAVMDEGLEIVFHTSSQRLGMAPVDLMPGESNTVTFDLKMHLAAGMFHLAVYLYRYDLEKELDRIIPAYTFFVEADRDVRGSANLYPVMRATSRAQLAATVGADGTVPADTAT